MSITKLERKVYVTTSWDIPNHFILYVSFKFIFSIFPLLCFWQYYHSLAYALCIRYIWFIIAHFQELQYAFRRARFKLEAKRTMQCCFVCLLAYINSGPLKLLCFVCLFNYSELNSSNCYLTKNYLTFKAHWSHDLDDVAERLLWRFKLFRTRREIEPRSLQR